MVDRALTIVDLAIYFYEHFLQIPLSVRICPHPTHSLAANFGTRHRSEPVPQKTYRLVANVNASFEQKVFNVSDQKRQSNIQHDRQANDLRRRFEITKWVRFCPPLKLMDRLARLTLILSDNAVEPLENQPNRKHHFVQGNRNREGDFNRDDVHAKYFHCAQ